MATAALVPQPNPSILERFPLTPQEIEVHEKIKTLKAMTPKQIEARWGDLKPEYVPKFKDTMWGGNVDFARDHWNFAEHDRALLSYKAKDYALCALTALAALPMKIYHYVTHLFCVKGEERAFILARDVQDITDAFTFIAKGFVWGLGNGALALFVDPVTLLYRYVYRNWIHKGPVAGLLIVDKQYGFAPANPNLNIDGVTYSVEAGSLPVNGAWEAVPEIHKLQLSIHEGGGTIVACKDSHPYFHGSFAIMLGVAEFVASTLNGIFQMGWPVHCVEGSRDWQFVPGIRTDLISSVVKKGLNQRVDSYSAFYDNGKKNKTVMTELLKEKYGVTDLYVVGDAYDFCVGDSAAHAAEEGFKTTVIRNATASVNCPLPAGNSVDLMNAKLAAAGVTVVETADELIGHSPFFPALPVVKV